MTFNGSLAGLVAITAGCDVVSVAGAAIIGIMRRLRAGLLAVEFFDKVLKIDDPVGAIGVHGVCGAMGTLLTGLLSTRRAACFYGRGFRFLGIQLPGRSLALSSGSLVTMTIIFTVIKKTVGLRVSAEEEIEGLDPTEHGLASAYADFMPSTSLTADPRRQRLPGARARREKDGGRGRPRSGHETPRPCPLRM